MPPNVPSDEGQLEGVAHTHPEPLNQLDQLNKIAIRRKNAPWLEELRS